MQDKVSVLIAVYNEEKYIYQCLKSIINQKINIEIIVVDDFSTDQTFEIVSKFLKKNRNLSLYKNNRKGKVNAFNLAFLKSSGNLICFFGGDDLMPENSLFLRKKELIDNSYYNTTLCKIKTISDIHKYNGNIIPKNKNKGLYSGQCYLFKRDVLNQIMPIPKSLPNEDTWLSIFVKYSELFRIYHHPIICCYYRIHENNSLKKDLKFEEFTKKIQTNYLFRN